MNNPFGIPGHLLGRFARLADTLCSRCQQWRPVPRHEGDPDWLCPMCRDEINDRSIR
jgi:predicted amidophosphoribosyltransferase